MRQGRTRQRSKPLSQRKASRGQSTCRVEADAGQRLASKNRAQKTKGIEDVVHRFKDEEACLQTRDLPNCSMVVLFGIGIRLWSVTECGCSSCWDGQLQEDLGQRVRLTQTTPQTRTGT